MKSFGAVKALKGLTFSVNRCEICGFLGPNGSGKSTTMRILTGLARPDSGSVSVFGSMLNPSKKGALYNVGVLIERPNFYADFSAARNLEIMARYSGLSDIRTRVDEILELVGLGERKKSKVAEFSEGMKQRLGLGQALLHEPELLILDEPFNGLDPQGVRDVRHLVQRMNEERGVSVLISSHNLDEIEKIATHMVLIQKGEIVAMGDVDTLLRKGKSKVLLRTATPEKAILVVEEVFPSVAIRHLVDGSIQIGLVEEEIPKLVESLTVRNIEIYEVHPRESLEQFFLSFTEQ